MALQKIKALCRERIDFLGKALEVITDEMQKKDFQYAKFKWECCLNFINGDKNRVVTDYEKANYLLFAQYGQEAIEGFINFSESQRDGMIAFINKLETIRNQSVDEPSSLEEISECYLFLGRFNDDICIAKWCLAEYKAMMEKIQREKKTKLTSHD